MKLHSALAAVSLAALSISAQAGTGLYLGGGGGQAGIEDTPAALGGVKFDETDVAWKAFAGFHLDAIPVIRLAAEAGYRDVGEPEATVLGVPVRYELSGYEYAGLAGIGLGPLEIFARYGQMEYELKKHFGPVTQEFEKDWATVMGVSVWLSSGNVGMRADYEMIDIPELDDVTVATVNLLFLF
jgi:hypothetical protein